MRPRRTGSNLALAVAMGTLIAPATLAAQESVPPTPEARQAAVNGLLSLALPGSGQFREGHARGWAYLALEAVAWTVWAERRHRAGTFRMRYRDLAWEAGRIRSGPRVDGDFPYYETLTSWTRSGAYDADPSSAGLQPESDADTYNGSIWSLARGLFLPSGESEPGTPEWDRALEYYRSRAYGEAFLWDWSGNPGDQARFADFIEESDDRFRQATLVLGAVLANHLVSAADAWLSTSLPTTHANLRVLPAVHGPPGTWHLSLHLGALP